MAAVYEPMKMLQYMPLGEVLRMTLLGNHERIGGNAHRIGLVSEVCPADELMERARWVADAIASPATSRSGIAAIDLGGERPRYQAGAVDGAIAADHRFRHDRYGGGQRLFLEADRPSDPLRRSQPWILARAAAGVEPGLGDEDAVDFDTGAPPAAAPPPALSAGAFAAASALGRLLDSRSRPRRRRRSPWR